MMPRNYEPTPQISEESLSCCIIKRIPMMASYSSLLVNMAKLSPPQLFLQSVFPAFKVP